MNPLARVRKWYARRKAFAPPKRGGRHRTRPLSGERLVYTLMGPQIVNFRAGSRGFPAAQILDDAGRPSAFAASIDGHLGYDLADLRDRSQQFDRANPIYQAVLSRYCDVLLGKSGVTYQARTADPEINKRLEELDRRANEQPEIRGLDDEVALQRLWLRHEAVDGDVGGIKLRETGQIQVVGGERIYCRDRRTGGGRRIEQGVELDSFDRPVAFHIADYDDYGHLRRDSRRVDAADFLFSAFRIRTDQTRGFPIQQANFAMFDRVSDICDSEAAAWQLLSRIAIAVTREDGTSISDGTSTLDDSADERELAKRYHELRDMLIFWGKPGEKVEGIGRNIPGSQFPTSIETFFRFIGLPFGFPLEFTLLIWSKTNYSSGRASSKQMERALKPNLKRMVSRLLIPRQTWRIQRWVRAGLVPVRADLFAMEYIAEPYPFIDPQKEGQAVQIRFQTGITAPSLELAEVGVDFDQLVTRQGQDLERILAEVNRLNDKYPGAGITLADFTSFVEPRTKKRWEQTADAPADTETDEGDTDED